MWLARFQGTRLSLSQIIKVSILETQGHLRQAALMAKANREIKVRNKILQVARKKSLLKLPQKPLSLVQGLTKEPVRSKSLKLNKNVSNPKDWKSKPH